MADNRASVLRMVLGEDYAAFEREFVVRSLEDLADRGRLSKKTLELIKTGIAQGEGLNLKEEHLEYQSRNARDGGGFLRVSLDLPGGVSLSSFVKIQSDPVRLKNESQLNRSLSEDAGSPYVLPILYLNEEKLLMATPFIEGERAQEAYNRDTAQQHELIERLAGSLLDVYRRARKKGIKPATNNRSKNGSQRVKDVVMPWLTGKKTLDSQLEGLISEVRRSVDDQTEPELEVLLHGDAQLNNFIVDGDKTLIIDWEMSRTGSIHYDIYRLLLRSREGGSDQTALLKGVWGFAREHLGYKKDISDFYSSYKRVECIEDLFVAGIFKDLSHSCEPSMKTALETAGDLYYTKSVQTARTLGLTALAKELEKNAAAMNCRELSRQEYETAETTLTVSDAGFSKYFQMSQPASKEEVRAVAKLMRQNKKAGIFRALKRAAMAAIVAAGIAVGGAYLGEVGRAVPQISQEQNEESYLDPLLEFDGMYTTDYLNDPNLRGLIEKHKLTDLPKKFWSIHIISSEDALRDTLKTSKEEYLTLFEGKPIPNPKYFSDAEGPGLIEKYSKRNGLHGPSNPLYWIVWSNLHKTTEMPKDRDPLTGLPYAVLDEICPAKDGHKRSHEELISAAASYLRNTLEHHKLDALDSIAIYYCGEDEVRRVQGRIYKGIYDKKSAGGRTVADDEIQSISRTSDNFWNYWRYLGEGGELAVKVAVMTSHNRYANSESYAYDIPASMKLSGKYRPSPSISPKK